MKNQVIAKNAFYNKQYKLAKPLFLFEKKYYEAGLCAFLLKDFEGAKKYWQKDKNQEFASSWGIICLDLIKKEIPNKAPSFFQIRTFFEIYLNLLIENKLFDYAENLINMYPYLSQINLEVCKFIARALFANDFFESSQRFIKIIKEQEFVDPEALLISAQINYMDGKFKESGEDLEKILKTYPEYHPAINLKKIIPN